MPTGGEPLGRWLGVVLSAALYTLSFPPFGWAALSWVALVPLWLALRSAAPLIAAGLSAVWGWLMTAAIIAWLVPTLHEHFGFSHAASVAFWLAFSAVVVAPFYALASALHAWPRRGPGSVVSPLLWAAAWVAAEYARTHLGFRSPWALLGDAHAESPYLRQVASVGGVYAVSGVVALGNAAACELVAFAWALRHSEVTDLRAGAVAGTACACALSAALVFGAIRITPDVPGREPASAGRALDVAIVQGNVATELRWNRAQASRVLRRYACLTREAVDRDAAAPDLVVWPENAIQTSLDDPVYGRALRELAHRTPPLLIGAPRSELRGDTRHHFNSAWLLRGERVEHYDKRRLLPFSEASPLVSVEPLASLLSSWRFGPRGDLDAGHYTPGQRPGRFELGPHTLGVLICMEALYPSLAREAARGGASVIVALSNDGWYRGRGGAEQHHAQSVFRAIETGLPLVRATTTGISSIVLPDGTVSARLGAGESGVLRATVALGARAPTLYTRVGDVFPIACCSALVASCAWPARRDRMRRLSR